MARGNWPGDAPSRIAMLMVGGAIFLLGGALAAHAQQRGSLPRVGLITPLSEAAARSRVDAFKGALRESGYVEGRTVTIECHYLDGRYDRVSTVLSELLRSETSVIVTHGTPATLAAKQATSSVPIVLFEVGDPVGMGLISGLAKPGGNVTGVSQVVAHEIYGKQLQMLTELIPRLSHVALLSNPANVAQPAVVKQTEVAAKALGLTLISVGAQGPDELEKAVLAAVRGRAGALIVSRDAVFYNHASRLTELVSAHRLPTMYGYRAFAEAGGLIGYGPDAVEISRRAASFTARILKGAKPADLPVEQPTKFELAINLKAAKDLGLAIPQLLLLQADQVITQ
jgi:putative tryptophan/tyrosine transport system substrate-binding protein